MTAREEPLDILIAEIWQIRGRGLILTGQLRAGVLKPGHKVLVTRPDGGSVVTMVRGVEFQSPSIPTGNGIAFLLGDGAEGFAVVGAVVSDPPRTN